MNMENGGSDEGGMHACNVTSGADVSDYVTSCPHVVGPGPQDTSRQTGNVQRAKGASSVEMDLDSMGRTSLARQGLSHRDAAGGADRN